MKRIKITTKIEESMICVSNSKNKCININPDNGTIKATDVFALFDNGIDVIYECDDKAIAAPDGKNLDKIALMYNDCLELINNIISAVNDKLKVLQIPKINAGEANVS